MIESLDDVRVGEYLICVQGPLITGTDSRGHFASKRDKTFEGTVIRVLAVSPPMMLIRVFPMPCGDPNHDHSPYATPVQFAVMGWSRPPYKYVKEYMKAADHKRPLPPSRAVVVMETISHEKLRKIVEQLEEHGRDPDTYGDDDDDDNTPVYER